MNKSEKLKFDFNDGAEMKPELEKELEKKKKEVEKELNKAADIVDDINDDDYEKPVFKDGSGKKIKYVTEKLHLNEDDLDEAIPKELANAYKQAGGYHRGDWDNYDLYNANYTAITPEEAYNQIKAGNSQDIRLLIDGKLITLRDNGYGDLRNRNKYVDRSKGYTKKNGDVITDTAHLPIKHMLSIADKIYLTDENRVFKDQTLKDMRAQNIESPNYYDNTWSFKDNPSYWLNNPSSKANRYYHSYEDLQKQTNELITQLHNGNITRDEYKQKLHELTDNYWHKRAVEYQNEMKDKRAWARYANSERDLQAPFRSYKDLKRALAAQEHSIKKAQDEIDEIKAKGDESNQYYRRKLSNYEAELEHALEWIAYYKMKLRYADDNDIDALKKANDELNDLLSKSSQTQAEFDKLMRRIPSNESYQPWGDAVITYNKIVKNNLVEDFNDIVDSLYPQGLSKSRLNDLLSYKQNMILEMLDLEVEDEK